jgi:hypothetical protein
MNYPIRQEYQLTIPLKLKRFDRFFWKKKITIKFQEWTLWEYFEFEKIKSDNNLIADWLVNLINKNYHKPVPIRLYNYCANQILEQLYNNLYPTIEKEQTWWKTDNKDDFIPLHAVFALFSEKLWILPNDLMNNYTLRQFWYILRGFVRNCNEQTDDWQRKNRSSIKPAVEIEKEKLDKIRQRQNNIFNQSKIDANNQSWS